VDSLNKIYIEPTNGCNLKCRTCIRHVWNEPEGEMEWDLYASLIEQVSANGTPCTIAFSGFGEPLMHPRFPDMVRLAHEKGLRTEVTSNAQLLSQSLASELVDAGLDQFVVSIDGTSSKTYCDVRDGASLETIKRNMRTFYLYALHTQHGRPSVRIGIEFVAMKRNISELPELSRIAPLIGASFIVVSNVIPHTKELKDEVLYGLKMTAYRGQGSRWVPTWHMPKMDWNNLTSETLSRIHKTQANVQFLDINLNERNNYCPFIHTNSITIAWDGSVSPCPALMHHYTYYVRDREKVVKPCKVGSLRGKSLFDIWHEPEYVSFRERVRTFDFPPCVDCNCELVESNEADCYGNTFPVCGDCLWARGIIRCA